MPLRPNSRLGVYEISAAIGAGGMGEVYRAHDSKLGRDVALKVLPEEFARDPERLTRFQREAKVLAALNHPNIASIYGFEDSSETHALVMELVDGPTLADRIKAGPIPVEEWLHMARQLTDALEYAHERGIVHRDLKPANVKVNAEDAVKVLDFGLAKAMEGEAASISISISPTVSRMATQAGVLVGTAAYMSPEQAKGKVVDRRADIWAFGCVLYEMLTGKMVFRGETVTDTLAAVIHLEPDWNQLPAQTPVRVRLLLERCLQKDPKRRLRDIGDARISLDEVLSGAPDPAFAGSPAEAAPLWRRALPWVIAGASITSSLAVFSWAYSRFPSSRNPTPEIMRFRAPVPENLVPYQGGEFQVSPDGHQLALPATGPDGVTQVWIRSIDSLEARPLPGSEQRGLPFFWSPDSRYIVFSTDGKLKKVSILGGAAEAICDLPKDELGGTWNRDDMIVVGQVPGPLMMVSAHGGRPVPLTVVDSSRGEALHAFPSFLPDGKHFIYLRASTIVGKSGVYVGSLDAKPEEQDSNQLVATDFSPAYVPSSDPGWGYVLFLRDGTLLAQRFDNRRLKLSGEPATVAQHVGTFRARASFSVSSNGVLSYRNSGPVGFQPIWLDRQGKVSATIGEPGAYQEASLSRDGQTLAVTQFSARSPSPGIGLISFAIGTDSQFTFGAAAEHPVWSSDGTLVAFESIRDGVPGLYRKGVRGAKDEYLLLRSNQESAPTSWSRDGRFLLYTSFDPATKGDLWVLPLENDGKPRALVRTEFNERDGRFSPDAYWIAYSSDESGRDEVYVRMFSTSASATPGPESKWLVSSGGGNSPRWRSDGKQLYYASPDGRLMSVDIEAGPEFRARSPKDLFKLPPGSMFQDVSADGKRFVVLAPPPQSDAAPFTVVLNWTEEMGK